MSLLREHASLLRRARVLASARAHSSKASMANDVSEQQRLTASALTPSSSKSWVANDSSEQQRHAVSALMHDFTQAQMDTSRTLVPWFLAKMPASYFRQVPEATRLEHLKAISSLLVAPRLTSEADAAPSVFARSSRARRRPRTCSSCSRATRATAARR